MPKKQKKTINKKTKLKNTVNVKINIDNSRKTTNRKASTKAPTPQPFSNFPSSQPMRIQQLEPKQQFNNADLSNKIDTFQKQFNTYLETKVKSEVKEEIPLEALSLEALPRLTAPTPTLARPAPLPAPPAPLPTVLQRLGSFFENSIDNFSTRDQEAIDRKEQQIKIKKEQREQKQFEAQQEFEVKRIIRMQKEAREKEDREARENDRKARENERLFNERLEKGQKRRESNERLMMESEDIPENVVSEVQIRDFIENASDEDIKLWLQNAQPNVKKVTLKIIKEKVKIIKEIKKEVKQKEINEQKEKNERLMMEAEEDNDKRLKAQIEDNDNLLKAQLKAEEKQKQKEAKETLMMYLEEDNDKIMAQLKPKKLKMVVNKLQETKPSLFQTNSIVKAPEIIKGLREYQAEPKETNKFKLNIQEKVKGLKQKEEPKRENLLNKELYIIQIDNDISILEEQKRSERDGRKRRPITTKINNLIKDRENLFMQEEDINIF